MAVKADAENEFAPSAPRLLFEDRYALSPPYGRNYDMALGRQRFVMLEETRMSPRKITFVLNPFEELKRHFPHEVTDRWSLIWATPLLLSCYLDQRLSEIDADRTPSYSVDMTKLLEPLIASPGLPHYVQDLREVLAREHTLRQEFYEEMTEPQKVEFINGRVVVPSPVQRWHSIVSDLLFTLLSTYVNHNDLGWVGHENLLVSLTRNDFEPDITFWRAVRAEDFAPDQVRFPAPDFVAEVLSAATEA